MFSYRPELQNIKEIPYKILGRHPYHFDIKNVSLPIESNNNIIYHAAN